MYKLDQKKTEELEITLQIFTVHPKYIKKLSGIVKIEAMNSTWLSSCQRYVRPIFEMKWRPRAFSRVSTGDSDILSSCDMYDEHA